MYRINIKIILLLVFFNSYNQLLAKTSADSTSITAMTFNVQMTKAYVELNKKEMVAGLIKSREMDIVGTQEYSFNELNNLAELLPDYSWIGAGSYDGETGGEFIAVLFLKEKMEILEYSEFWLSENPDISGSRSWNTEHTRIVLWCKFRDRLNDRIFYVFNTHFDNGSSWAREMSSALLLEKIDEIAKRNPVIVTGDFNFEENSEAYKILMAGKPPSTKLFDTRYLSTEPSFGPSGTFNGYSDPVPNSTIDYIFVNPFVKVFGHGVIDDRPDDIYISDHYPVISELILYYPQIPIMPSLTAVPGDKEVFLMWDNIADTETSDIVADRVNDFEGYKLYRSTDIEMSDAVIVKGGWDIPMFRKPVFQCDLKNGKKGFVNYGIENGVSYYLGDDTNIKHFYKDTTVQNGRSYYYVLTAYDYGNPEIGFDLPPKENSFSVDRGASGNIKSISKNMQIVTPTYKAAGYLPPAVRLRDENQTQGVGHIVAEVVDIHAVSPDQTYKVKFQIEEIDHLRAETVRHPSDMLYACNGFSVYEVSAGDSLVYQENPGYYSGKNMLIGQYRKGYSEVLDYYYLNESGVVSDIFNGIQLQIFTPYILPEFNPDGSGWLTGDSPVNVKLSETESMFFPWQYDIIFTDNDSAYVGRTTSYSKIYTADGSILSPLDLILSQPYSFYVLNKSFPDSLGEFEKLDLLTYDVNQNHVFDPAEDKILAGHAVEAGSRIYWGGTVFEIDFHNVANQSQMPSANDVYRLDFYRPFIKTDSLMFTLESEVVSDQADVKKGMEQIKVVPNPYIATNTLESASMNGKMNYQRRIMFTHVPADCKIKIFTISGILVTELRVNNSVENRQTDWDLNSEANGTAFWDLKTKKGREVAAGYYLYHVKSKRTGNEKLGKFAIIK